MNDSLQNYYRQPENFKQLVWDYRMDPKEFFDILEGKIERHWLGQDWAICRVLENLNYYEAIQLVPLVFLHNHWSSVKTKLFKESIKKGYEFVLQKHALSTAR